MKIKKIAIHGFKSFLDKTTLSFPSATSAIIGPNGCGKSNVVDAIRWVIGEQNPRHLRGKLMEDVIFNGSDVRKPLGVAEVTLTFCNERGHAGARFANFSEIEISRRLYRSGESEYYLNKVQCRLRDIAELFTDTGIGTRAYSIIEQGQVGWLINAKPHERRVLFEEAAGINKFKQKKEAALRRLAATTENLTRVSDIISEVKRQLNSLNRQAKKAERYKVVKEEYKEIDLMLSSVGYLRLTGELTAAVKRIEEIEDRETALSASLALREAAGEETRENCLKEEEGFRAVKDRVYALEKEVQNVESTSALAGMRTEELHRNEERLKREIDEIRGSRDAAAREIDGLKALLEDSRLLIEEESRKVDEAAGLLESVLERLRSKEDAERSLKAESLKIHTRLTDIRHTLQALLKDEEFFRVKAAKAGSEKEESGKRLAGTEEPVRALRERIEGSRSRKAEIEAGLDDLRTLYKALEEQRAGLDGELESLKGEHAMTSARLSTLQEMERNYENLNNGARSILKRHKHGIHGLMADVIETNPGYEQAVEAVMGERLQYVIVESHQEGVEAIEYLKSHAGGRGSFVSVRDSRPVKSPVPAGGEGYSFPGTKDLLSEVKVKEGYGKIVSCLLGDVLVVDDLAAALDIWRRNGIYKTLVTLDGEVVDQQGIITGGSAKERDDGLLKKRSEIKDISAKLSVLETRIASLEDVIRGTDEELNNAGALVEEKRDRLHSMELETVNLEGELKRLDEEASRLAGSIETLASEIADSETRLAEISVAKASLSRERDELDGLFSVKEQEIDSITGEISTGAEEKETLSGELTTRKVTLAKAKERGELLSTQVEDKSRLIEDSERRLVDRAGEIERGRVEIAEKTRESAELKARIEGLLGRIGEIKAEEVSRQEAVAELTERIRGIEVEVKGLKTEIEGLKDSRGNLSFELKETELKISNLNEKIIERYGVDIEHYAAPAPPAPPSQAGQGEAGEEEASAPVPPTPEEISALEERREELRAKLASMGEVSLSALEEYKELETRYEFLINQQSDLQKSVDSLHAAIQRINRTTREKFKKAFEEINEKFKENFPRLFSGGRAELRMTEGEDVLEAGIDIAAQPPGKRLQNIALLSGGEKALTAIALIFSLFLIKPSPFCMLDEVDAPLDDANIDKFNAFVREMSSISQFILITHNKRTMEMVDALYGVTMEEPGVSKIISVKF
jgi:chromosome segregation protein